MPYNLKTVRNELNTLCFAKITNVLVDNSNLINSGCASDDDRMFSHFCGFAVRDDGASIWFKKSSFQTLYLGGVKHRPPLSVFKEYPQKGQLIVGQTRKTEKGLVFDWWTHKAEPLWEFKAAIDKGPRALSSSTRSFGKLRTQYTRAQSEDDLWLTARLLLLKDTASLAKEYGPEEQRLRHPGRSSKGIWIERNPVEFVYLTAYFARDVSILKDFYSAMGGALPAHAELYSVESLNTLLEK